MPFGPRRAKSTFLVSTYRVRPCRPSLTSLEFVCNQLTTIAENVNLATANQYSLHTFPSGCFHPNSSSGETGTLQASESNHYTLSPKRRAE